MAVSRGLSIAIVTVFYLIIYQIILFSLATLKLFGTFSIIDIIGTIFIGLGLLLIGFLIKKPKIFHIPVFALPFFTVQIIILSLVAQPPIPSILTIILDATIVYIAGIVMVGFAYLTDKSIYKRR